MTICFCDAKRKLEMPMKKARGSNCFDIYPKRRLKVLDFCLDSFTKVKSMYNLFGLQL